MAIWAEFDQSTLIDSDMVTVMVNISWNGILLDRLCGTSLMNI